jgi:hypothetical protein
VPARRREIELSVERPVAGGGGLARLTARFDSGPDGRGPSPTELRAVFEELLGDLEATIGVPLAGALGGRPDRDVQELVETYRPRQRDLVDVLLSDGEISPTEHARLLEHLRGEPPRPVVPARVPPAPPTSAPIAAAPVAAEPSLPPARPVEELLRSYQIESLKQAGAVRARRQISFAEYMALKRHFEGAVGDAGGRP